MIDVVIIGSGPAGLAAAIELRRQAAGQVVVLEREPSPGGIPRHCAHPPYGIREFGRLMTGPSYARRLVARAAAAGVDIRLQHSVVSLLPSGRLDVVSPKGRMEIQARRVIVATGAREAPRSARLISGDRPIGVCNTGALQSFIHLQKLVPFRRPVIIGTELVGLSAIMTCRTHGIKPVAVVEEAARPTARWPLGLFPQLLGIPVFYNTSLSKIEGEGRVSTVTLTAADGSTKQIDCDGVLLTGRFLPEASLIMASHLHFDEGTKGPRIDQFGRCSDNAYFAVGNILRPVETAGWSYREGRRIAVYVAADLRAQLPAATAVTVVRPGAGIKLVVPQTIAYPGALLGARWLEARVDTATTGHLRVCAGAREIWQKKISLGPERRILISIGKVLPKVQTAELTVEIIP